MKRIVPILVLVLLAAVLVFATSTTYTQPFAVGHGFAWTTTTGACDTSLTPADDTVDGNPVNSVKITCIGRNDSPQGRWGKAMTWETMGVPAGENVTQVDGKFDHAIITRTHTSAPVRGPLQIFDSGDASACTASDLEGQTAYASGTGGTAWATDNATGAVNVNAGCQASNTTVTVRMTLGPFTGNNASATTQVNGDNLILTITSSIPAAGKSRLPLLGVGTHVTLVTLRMR